MSNQGLGKIDVSLKTISSIIVQTLKGLPNVVGLASQNRVDGASQLLPWESERGIEIVANEGQISINLYLILFYGEPIRPIAEQIQQAIGHDLENMLNLRPQAINVFVQGLHLQAQ